MTITLSKRRQLRNILLVACCFVWLLLYLFFPRSKSIDPTYGRLDQTTEQRPNAIATFLTGNTREDEDDFYFVAARMLTYQILHANETRCRKPVPFLVLVTDTVSADKQAQLTRDGATVIPAKDVPLRWWIKTGVTRWYQVHSNVGLLN
jgi:hypothetical protein